MWCESLPDIVTFSKGTIGECAFDLRQAHLGRGAGTLVSAILLTINFLTSPQQLSISSSGLFLDITLITPSPPISYYRHSGRVPTL